MSSISNYNALLPFMENLNDQGYRINKHTGNLQGYGFYIDGINDYYIKVNCDSNSYVIDLMRHNSKCAHDVLNDILVEPSRQSDLDTAKKAIQYYLEKMQELPKSYMVNLTEEEIEAIIGYCEEHQDNILLAYRLKEIIKK